MDEEPLADVFYLYGELKNSRRIAAALVEARALKAHRHHTGFHQCRGATVQTGTEKRHGETLSGTRIEVNHKNDGLKEMLAAPPNCSGLDRLSVITYHSLEDRIVKNIMKAGNGRQNKQDFGRIETPSPDKQQGDNTRRRRTRKQST